MGRKPLFDQAAIGGLLARQDAVVTRRQLVDLEMSDRAIRHRLRLGGPWRVLLPGVYLASTGIATPKQRELAAVLYAGNGCAITGPAALAAHGIPVPDSSDIDVLIPAGCQRRDVAFVRVHRTARMPATLYPVGLVRYVPPVRAVADTARQLADIADVRAVVARAVQGRKVRVADLVAELEVGPSTGSATLRVVLAEVADGVRSAAEGDLRALIKRYRLPDPMYNPGLFVGADFLARPDTWWPESGVAVEVDSREWHLSPRDWERTLARHSRMSSLGIIVPHYPPSRLRGKQAEVVATEIRSALDSGTGRRLPAGLRAEPAR